MHLDHHQNGVHGNHPARKDIDLGVVFVTTDSVPENPNRRRTVMSAISRQMNANIIVKMLMEVISVVATQDTREQGTTTVKNFNVQRLKDQAMER